MVFHLAASVGNKRSIENPLLDSQIKVIGTLNVLEACRKADVRKILYSSSAGIFEELKEPPALGEVQPTGFLTIPPGVQAAVALMDRWMARTIIRDVNPGAAFLRA